MATSEDLTKLTSQLTSIETHAKAVLSWVAEARKTIAALAAEATSTPPTGGFTGGY